MNFGGERFKDKKEAVEPEVDPERDQRTVFAYQMPLKVTERDVFEFFSQAGKVCEDYNWNTFHIDDVKLLPVFHLVMSSFGDL
ncbi:Splicing factor [Perilla frutescens var. hirtella]|nr:hypothetical protein C2S51_037569 [Perilla frutescens var. frutescens]KAH6788080.1 Splicing factor [Perilla frutescens var. hirtella]